MEPYMVPVLHCCSDERGWSSSARWHGNVTEGSELGSSLRCCHSSVSPRHWFDRETERRTPSEVEKMRQIKQMCLSDGCVSISQHVIDVYLSIGPQLHTLQGRKQVSSHHRRQPLSLSVLLRITVQKESHIYVIFTTRCHTHTLPFSKDDDGSHRRVMET